MFLSDITSSGNYGALDMQIFVDFHIGIDQDARVAQDLVREAAYLSGLRKLDTDQEPFRPHKVVFFQTRFEFQPSRAWQN